MLFRRRETPGITERLRVLAWPRVSWQRSAKYFSKRILRLSGSPHTVSAGVAAGVAASMTPFLGFHFILAFVLAFVVRGNMVAAALGTFVGNPLTFPIIWAAAYELGAHITGSSHPAPAALTQGMLSKSFSEVMTVFEPLVIGSLPLALATGLLAYVVVRKVVTVYGHARRERLAARRRDSVVLPAFSAKDHNAS
jgi:uncharacterized protein (DUF2062 family)